jgi:outer membrane protein assembly factor BamA
MNCKNGILALLVAILATGCATTKLAEGEYRLAGNKIKVAGKQVSSSELTSYVTQKPSSSLFGIRKRGTPPVVLDESQVGASIDNIRNHLEYIGFYGSQVTSEVEFKDKNKKAYVTYYVVPGKQYQIRTIAYELPDDPVFREEWEQDQRRTTIKEGQILSEASLEAETVRCAEFFRNRGYFGFDKSYFFCEADTLRHDGTAALLVAIRDYPRGGSPDNAKPHKKFTIGNVTLSYPVDVPIRTNILEELNVLRPGMPYSERVVNATYSRLSNLAVFNSVNVAMNPVSDDVVDCDISLLNGGVQGFKANLEASVNSTGLFGISPQINYFHKNFFHGGELFNLGLKGNFQFKTRDNIRSTEFSASSTLRIPKLIGLPNSLFRGLNLPHTDVTLGFSYQDRPEYKRMMISTSFGYTGTFRRNFTYQFFPFQANIVRLLGDVSESFAERLVEDLFLLNAYSDHFDLGMGGMLYYTTDPTPIPKRTYTYGRLNFDISGNTLSLFNPAMPTDEMTGQHLIWSVPYAQYVRGELQLGQTFRFGGGDNQAVALRFLIGAGYGYGNSTTVPFEKQFYAGGANSMRGWQARALGPGRVEPWTEYFLIPSQTGDFKMEANVEYRFPIVWKLEGALFADAGNVWDLRQTAYLEGSNFSFDTIAADWGMGIRVNLDFILIRVDLGAKVYEPCRPVDERLLRPEQWLKSGNFALHFGVGYPF